MSKETTNLIDLTLTLVNEVDWSWAFGATRLFLFGGIRIKTPENIENEVKMRLISQNPLR